MSDPRGSAARFAVELKALHRAAGSPTYVELVRQGRRQVPTVAFSVQTISDWLGGKSVPARREPVRLLVDLLEPRAVQGGGYVARGWSWWSELYERARQDRRANRGGRPRTRSGRDLDEPAGKCVLGRTIGELDETDAVLFGVHPAVTVSGQNGDRLPVLPPYLPRPHDADLRGELSLARRSSRIVLLIGDSSTGKSRACWEAMRAVLPDWRAWHPLAPERSEAVVQALRSAHIGPRTVIWLNEAQLYLRSGSSGEQVASALHEMLHDPSIGPILVLGSMWPQHYDQLTDSEVHEHAAAQQLLSAAATIQVPTDFTDRQLTDLQDLVDADARLRFAAERAGRRISQFLAGAFELERKYLHADEPTRAVVWAAMDAHRLDRDIPLTEDFLRDAAPSYIDRNIWDRVPDDWFVRALTYLTKPVHGVPGPLSRGRLRLGDPSQDIAGLRLADYLDQVGQTTRAGICPQAGFWEAVGIHITDPRILSSVAYEAQCRGRYRRAAHLYRLAADRGDTSALLSLARLREEAGEPAEARSLRRTAINSDKGLAVDTVVRLLEEMGDHESACAAAQKAADGGDSYPLAYLAGLRTEAGDYDGAAQLCVEIAGDIFALPVLAELRDRAGDHDGATRLYQEAADGGDIGALQWLAWRREQVGDREGATQLYQEAADRGDPRAARKLIRLREQAGDHIGALTLAREYADRTGNAYGFVDLARLREEAGDHDGAIQMYWEAADRGHPNALEALAELRELAGDHAGAIELYRRSAADGGVEAVEILAQMRERAGDHADAAQLCLEYADRGDPNALGHLADVWERAGEVSLATQLRAFGLDEDGSAAGPW